MTTLDLHIAPAIQAEIQNELDRIEDEFDVRILLAIESGSRAWGFPSPDSDYDVRFIYANSVDWYLSLTPGRDVIERPISDDLDIGGWDIRKALNLMLKGNAVVDEWLQSPITYRRDEGVHAKLRALSRRAFNPKACFYHYLNLGEENFRRHIHSQEQVKLKKYFYSLRPALALEWLFKYPQSIPPMTFQGLRDGADIPQDVDAQINQLMIEKAKTRESGLRPHVEILDHYIEGVFERASEFKANISSRSENAPFDDATDLFQRIIHDA